MLVSEMEKDIEALQTRMLALEYIIQSMLKNMPITEKEKLINSINVEKQNIPMIEDAFKIIKTHLDN